MTFHKSVFLLIFLFATNFCSGQIDIYANKYPLFGTTRCGICFGNWCNYNGYRFNNTDTASSPFNGINIFMYSDGNSGNGVQIGVIRAEYYQFNGVSFASISQYGSKLNGVGISAFGVVPDTLNGLGVGLFLSSDRKHEERILNGVGLSIFGADAGKMNGFYIGGYCSSDRQKGLSIALFNHTKGLHGLQLGVINYAGNNRKLFRWMPFFNVHL